MIDVQFACKISIHMCKNIRTLLDLNKFRAQIIRWFVNKV